MTTNVYAVFALSKSTGSDFQTRKTNTETICKAAIGKNKEYAQLPPVLDKK